MRGDLQALIDLTGLSIKEAAAILGIGHEALSRKLAGKARYEPRQAELERLLEVKAFQDWQVQAALDKAAALAREHGVAEGDSLDITLLTYRRDDDLPPDDIYPASVTRMIAARIKAASPWPVDIVLFDRHAYDDWRAGRIDTRDARTEWAAGVGQPRTRFGLKIAYQRKGPGGAADAGIGWAVLKTKQALVERGAIKREKFQT